MRLLIKNSCLLFKRTLPLISVFLLFSTSCKNVIDNNLILEDIPIIAEKLSDQRSINSALDCNETIQNINVSLFREETKRAFYIAFDLYNGQEFSSSEINSIVANNLILQGLTFNEAYEYINQYNSFKSSSSFSFGERELTEKLSNDLEEFKIFVVSNEANLQESLDFWEEKITLNQLNLIPCARDKQLFEIVAYSIQGFLEFYYESFNHTETPRDCLTIWEELGCSATSFFDPSNLQNNLLGSLGVGLGIAAIAINPWGGIAVTGLAIIAIFDNNSNEFNECCDALNPVGCWPAKYIFPVLLDCDSDNVEIRAIGSGYGINSWVWENQNTLPSAATTIEPRLTVAIGNVNNDFLVRVSSICSDGTNEGQLFEAFGLGEISVDANPDWISGQEPPNYAFPVSTHTVEIEENPVQSNIEWTTTGNAQIQSVNAANLKASVFYTGTGAATVKVTVTDICSGENLEISKSTIVSW